jgi:hypothetical protein
LPIRRDLCVLLGGLCLLGLMACSGERRTFANSQREAIPTNVVGKSDTSGISAGAALSAPGSAPTQTPTVTPVPSK